MAVLCFIGWIGRTNILGLNPENDTSLFPRLSKTQRNGDTGYLVARLLYAVGDSEHVVV